MNISKKDGILFVNNIPIKSFGYTECKLINLPKNCNSLTVIVAAIFNELNIPIENIEIRMYSYNASTIIILYKDINLLDLVNGEKRYLNINHKSNQHEIIESICELANTIKSEYENTIKKEYCIDFDIQEKINKAKENADQFLKKYRNFLNLP